MFLHAYFYISKSWKPKEQNKWNMGLYLEGFKLNTYIKVWMTFCNYRRWQRGISDVSEVRVRSRRLYVSPLFLFCAKHKQRTVHKQPRDLPETDVIKWRSSDKATNIGAILRPSSRQSWNKAALKPQRRPAEIRVSAQAAMSYVFVWSYM